MHSSDTVVTPTWSNSSNPLARGVAQPLQRFLHREIAGGALLLIATIAALIWANIGHSYHDFWETEVDLTIGPWSLLHHGHSLTLHSLVNDALMGIFFFVVGLEIKREWTTGHLVDRRAAIVPMIGAIGGMVVPAVFYLAIAGPSGAANGWGIPMATDIAFALGALSVLGSRVPSSLKVFLLTLAIVDDIGAILVIALFYSSGISTVWLGVVAICATAMIAARRAGVRYIPTYVIVGVTLWYALLQSGVHATLAGVICGLLTPAHAWINRSGQRLEVVNDPKSVRQLALAARESVPVTERLEEALHPFTAFIILPIFALANAGIPLTGEALATIGSPVALGVGIGLLLGKTLGISLSVAIAVKSGLGPMPAGTTPRHIVGVGALSGIGFTVAMFVAGLAFTNSADVEAAKFGILVASFAAVVVGLSVLSQRSNSAATETVHQLDSQPSDEALAA